MGDSYLLSATWTTDPLTQDELDGYLEPVRAVMKRLVVMLDPDDRENTIDWHYVRDEIIPDADSYIDSALRPIYAVPLQKTDVVVDGAATKYSRKITRMAAYYVAARIASRAYASADMPNQSPEAQDLMAKLDMELADLTSGRTRLIGQRLKGRDRTANPHFVPYAQPKDASEPPPAPGGRPA